MNQEKIGKYIQERRKEKKLTQKELADKLRISEKTISKWECGNGLPEVSLMQPLCDELDITVTELLNGKGNKEQNVIKYLQHENKKSKRQSVIISLVILLLITTLLFTGTYFINSYNKIIFYKLYGESDNFTYSDGLITKSNINNVYSFGKISIKNPELNQEDIYYIEVNCDESIVFGQGNQYFYQNNGILFIEENGYNEIMSPYKLENLDKWTIEIVYNDEGKKQTEIIEVKNEEVMSNNKFFSLKTKAISNIHDTYQTESENIKNRKNEGTSLQNKYYQLLEEDNYTKSEKYNLVKKISDQEEIKINCKENIVEYYNATNPKNKYTIIGKIINNKEYTTQSMKHLNIIGYENNKTYNIFILNEKQLSDIDSPIIINMINDYNKIRQDIQEKLFNKKA